MCLPLVLLSRSSVILSRVPLLLPTMGKPRVEEEEEQAEQNRRQRRTDATGNTQLRSAARALADMAVAHPAASYEFDPSKPKSDRGRAHYESLQKQQGPPIPVVSNKLLIFGIAIASLLFGFAIHIIRSANLLQTLHPHHWEQCEIVKGPVGCEDFALDHHGVLIIPADARVWAPQPSRDGFTRAGAAEKNMAKLGPNEQGAFWAYDARPKTQSSTAGNMVKLQIEGLPSHIMDIHPHGIAIPRPPASAGPNAPVWIYAINHARDGHDVVILEAKYGPGKASFPPSLHYRGRVRDPAHLKTNNDLEAFYPLVQKDGSLLHSFYVTNFMGSAFGDALWSTIEMFTHRPWGSVALCQATSSAGGKNELVSTRCTFALEGISGPNGIALSKDQTQLYLARTYLMDMLVLDLPRPGAKDAMTEWSHGSIPLLPLSLNATVPTGTGLDNLSLEPISGDIFVGAHPKLLQTGAHLSDPTATHPAPTQVLRIRHWSSEQLAQMQQAAEKATVEAKQKALQGDSASDASKYLHHALAQLGMRHPEYEVEEVHLSLGDVYAASSVGVWNRPNKQLLIGNILQDGIWVCPYPAKDQAE